MLRILLTTLLPLLVHWAPCVSGAARDWPADIAPAPVKRFDVYGMNGLTTCQVRQADLWKAGGPSWQDVAQKATGDCWLVAAAASIAYVDAGRIEGMMVDHPNKGKVDVTLYVSETETKVYTVERPTTVSSESDQFGVSPSDPILQDTAMWPAIMELAFIEWAADNPDSGVNSDLNGGWSPQAYEVIYGKTAFEEVIFDLTRDRLIELLQTAKPTALSLQSLETLQETYPDRDFPFYDNYGLPTGHAYTLIYYDPETEMVTIRNPWDSVGTDESGGIVALKDGQFTISLHNLWHTWYFISGV